MSDNPLVDTPEREARIREVAYRLWEEDGRPDGRDVEFWERARELVGIEESPGAGLVHESVTPVVDADGEPIEEASIQDNLGEFPDRSADQGEHRATPMTRQSARGGRSR